MTSDRWLGFMHILLGALVGLLFLALIGVVCAPRRASAGSEGGQAPPTVSEAVVGASRLPQDPFQRCAVRALRGDWGTLQPWQRDAYAWGLARGLTVPPENRAKVTSYGPWEPCGDTTYSGEPVSLRWVSVDPSVVPLGTLLWTPWGLRYAMDTGGAVKVGRPYTRAGETQNLDYYTLRGVETQRRVPWLVVKHWTEWNWYGARLWRDWSKRGPCPAKYLP